MALSSLKNPANSSTLSIKSISGTPTSIWSSHSNTNQSDSDIDTIWKYPNEAASSACQKEDGNGSHTFDHFLKMQKQIDIPTEYSECLEFTQTDKDKKQCLLNFLDSMNKKNEKSENKYFFLFDNDGKLELPLKEKTDYYFYHLATRIVKALYDRNRMDEAISKGNDAINTYNKYNFNNLCLKTFENEENEKQLFDAWPIFIHGIDKEGHPIMYDELGTKDLDFVVNVFGKNVSNFSNIKNENNKNILKKNEKNEKNEKNREKGKSNEEKNELCIEDEKFSNQDLDALNESFCLDLIREYRCRWFLRTLYVNCKVSNYFDCVNYKHILVMNCSNFSFLSLSKQWNLWNLLIKKIIQSEQEYFPETLHKLFIINVPWSFTFFWKIVSQFIDKKVLNKIYILGNDYLQTFTKFIDINQIPTKYGGKSKIPISYDYQWK